MKLNLVIPRSMEIPGILQPWEWTVGPDEIRTTMQLADKLGYHKVILGEHFLIPKSHIELSGAFYHHATVALAIVAGQTKQLKLASTINILPLQHAVVQAKAWSTLDWLSNGRANAIVGVGWLKEEFDYLNVPFHERGRICDEYVAAMIELWTQDQPHFEGKYVNFEDCAFEPKPIQKPHLPLWFGGDSKPAFDRIAKWGTGWAPFTTPPEKFQQSLDYVKSHPAYHDQTIEVFFSMMAMKIGDGHAVKDAPNVKGSWNPEEIIDLCGQLAEYGVTETIVTMPRLDSFEAYLDYLRWVAEEIMPRI